MSGEMTPASWQLWCLAALALAMAMAIESDLRARRIPNVLVLFLLAAGVTLNALGPANGRAGMFSQFPGALGAGTALLGALAGLALFLPLHGLRAMGAGDVKLLAGLGAFVGPAEIISLALCILVAGGLLSIVRMLWARNSRLVLSNVKWALVSLGTGGRSFDPATQSADRMPYALAFAGGLLAYGYWRLSGGAPLIRF